MQAQGQVDAALRGRVVGAHDGSVSGVDVSVRSADDVPSRTIRADKDGAFVLLHLAPGDYVVSAGAHADDATAEASIHLEAGEIADVTLRLIAAGKNSSKLALASSIALGSFASSIALRSSTGAQYTEDQIARLPLRSRQWEDLAELDTAGNDAALAAAVPGNAGDEDEGSGSEADSERGSIVNDGGASSGLSYNGISLTQNAQTIDGLSNTQNFRSGPRGSAAGGPRVGASFGEGAVGSFRILPRTFSAQYGGAVGAVVAVASRGSTARLHGSAFVLSRQSAWAATNPFSVVTRYHDGAITNSWVKPDDSMQQFGGAVGLPLSRGLPGSLRGHVAVFASLEAQLRDDDIVSSPAVASFYALSPMQLALLGNRGVTAAATNTALDYLDSLTGTVARNATRTLGFGRVDAELSSHDHVTLGYIRNRFDAPSGAALGQSSEAVVARGTASLGDSVVHIDAFTARWLHTFSPRWSNDVRLQVSRDLEYETPHAPLAQEPAISPGGLAPQVSIAPNGFAYGTPASLGRTAYPDEHRVEVADTIELRLGQHLLNVGGDWSRIDDRIASLTNAEGSFLYDSGTTGGHAGGLVDWITDYTFNVHAYPNGGCPNINAAVHLFCFRSFTQSFGEPLTEFVTHDFAGFVEDSFRARNEMTFTFGVRYDYTLLPLPQAPNVALDTVLSTVLGGSTSSFPEDRNNIGPRLGFAWSPRAQRGKEFFTMHVGYGLFYGRVPGATVRAALADTALPSTTTSIRITPSTVTTCPQVANQGFGYACAYDTAPPAAVAQTTSTTVFDNHFRVPAVQRATLALEREFGAGAKGSRILLRANYVMSVATQLPSSVDRNVAPSTTMGQFVMQGGDGQRGLRPGETFFVPLYTARISSQYGPVTAVESNANATYHAGTIEARMRLRGPLELRGSYTFSRAIDYGPQQGATPSLNGQFDPFTDGYDKGLSSLQFPQRFAGDLVYALVVARGPMLLRRVANGWRVAALATASSGAPYSYGVFGGTRLSGGHETMNGSGGATYLPATGRNTLRLPARSHADVRVGRDFAIRSMRLNAFAEAFNILNTQNFSSVETRAFLLGTPATIGAARPLIFQDAATIASEGLTTPAFGTPLSSTTGLTRERQVELGARLEF